MSRIKMLAELYVQVENARELQQAHDEELCARDHVFKKARGEVVQKSFSLRDPEMPQYEILDKHQDAYQTQEDVYGLSVIGGSGH